MNDEDIFEFIDSLVDLYSDDELKDYEYMKNEMTDLMGLRDEHILPLWTAALQIKALRGTKSADWKALVAIN